MNSKKKIDILNAAMEVFAKNGYQEATISNIADLAGVADATIYDYFKNKEDLLFSIPEEKMKEIISLAHFHLQGIKGALNKIRKFVWLYLWVLQTYKDWALVVMLDLKTNKKFVEMPGYQLLRQFFKIIISMVEEGKSEGCIRKEVNPFIFRSMLVGTIEHLTIRWLILNKPEELVALADDVADLLIQAVKV